MGQFDIEQMPRDSGFDESAKSRRVISPEEADRLPSRRYRPYVYGGSGRNSVTVDTQWNKDATMMYLVRITFEEDGRKIERILHRDELMGYLRTE